MDEKQLKENTEAWRDQVVIQILTIRDSGITNMFDMRNVRELAVSYGFDELTDFILKNKSGYCSFILGGDREKITIP
jgi:hypothetical protein